MKISELNRIYRKIKEKDIIWTAYDIFHRQLLIRVVDRCVIWFKKHKFAENEIIVLDLPSHTINENKRIWDNYDWSQAGEEWTSDVKRYKGLDPNSWKTFLINEMMLKYIKKGSTILEIGPGAGRWTEILQTLASWLILVEISEKCLNLCKERFKTCNNIEYRLFREKLDFIDSNSIDYIWTYDVFVHINPTDVERYIEGFQRILKPGGCAIIHHSGTFSEQDRVQYFRSYMGGKLFAHLVAKHGMKMIEQNDTLVHKPGDLISVFIKPF